MNRRMKVQLPANSWKKKFWVEGNNLVLFLSTAFESGTKQTTMNSQQASGKRPVSVTSSKIKLSENEK